MLIDYEEGIGSLWERIKRGNIWENPYTYEGVFIDIDWIADNRSVLEKVAPKKLRQRIEENNKELLKIADFFRRKDPNILEYLVESLGDVIPQLRHLLQERKAETATKS